MSSTEPEAMPRLLFVCLLLGFHTLPGRGQTTPLTRAAAVHEALTRAPAGVVLAADTAIAFAQTLVARALPNPSLSASYSAAPPNYHFTADLPFDFLWLRDARVQAARLGQLAARYRYSFGRAALALDADTAYTGALAALARARLSSRTSIDSDSLLQMAIARRNAGDASELDVQLATVAAGQQANAAAADSVTAVAAILDLQAILGMATDRILVTLVDSLTDPPDENQVSPPTSALPVAAATAALDAADISAKLEHRSVWAGTGLTLGVETSDPETGSKLLPLVGISLPLPFFNQNRAGIALAEANRSLAAGELALARIETASLITRATREREASLRRVERDRLTLAAADRVASMSLTAYREGAMALPAVIEAQRAAREIETTFIDDLAAAWIATAELRLFTMPATSQK
jgi:cobalt-zinc-cadmium efflux system outer membrane protein